MELGADKTMSTRAPGPDLPAGDLAGGGQRPALTAKNMFLVLYRTLTLTTP